jgi:hypothetical protein
MAPHALPDSSGVTAPKEARPIREVRANLKRLGRVRRDEIPAVLITLAIAIFVEVGLRVLRLPTLARIVGVPLGEVGPVPDRQLGAGELSPRMLRRLRISAKVMRSWPFDEKCLRRSLVCGCRIRSVEPALIVGVAIVEGEVKAHAWLSVGGATLDPWGSASFAGLVPIRRP